MGRVFNATPRATLPREKDHVPIIQEAGWAPGPVRTGADNLALTGVRSSDRPAISESLYLLNLLRFVHLRTTALVLGFVEYRECVGTQNLNTAEVKRIVKMHCGEIVKLCRLGHVLGSPPS
jgi:hypothetical protein